MALPFMAFLQRAQQWHYVISRYILVSIHGGVVMNASEHWVKTRVFQSGNSQALRIPKEFQLDTEDVEICELNGELRVRKVKRPLGDAFEALSAMDNVFADGREQPAAQDRDGFE